MHAVRTAPARTALWLDVRRGSGWAGYRLACLRACRAGPHACTASKEAGARQRGAPLTACPPPPPPAQAIRREAPRIGGSFAVWGGLFSTFDCTLVALRKKEDPWNSIAAGALTGESPCCLAAVGWGRSGTVVTPERCGGAGQAAQLAQPRRQMNGMHRWRLAHAQRSACSRGAASAASRPPAAAPHALPAPSACRRLPAAAYRAEERGEERRVWRGAAGDDRGRGHPADARHRAAARAGWVGLLCSKCGGAGASALSPTARCCMPLLCQGGGVRAPPHQLPSLLCL